MNEELSEEEHFSLLPKGGGERFQFRQDNHCFLERIQMFFFI
jgi:hypothetical protein